MLPVTKLTSAAALSRLQQKPCCNQKPNKIETNFPFISARSDCFRVLCLFEYDFHVNEYKHNYCCY